MAAAIIILLSLWLLKQRRQQPQRRALIHGGLLLCLAGMLALIISAYLPERDDAARTARRVELNRSEHEVFLRRLAHDLRMPHPRILMIVSPAFLHEDPSLFSAKLKASLATDIRLDFLTFPINNPPMLLKDSHDLWAHFNRRIDGVQLTRATLIKMRQLESNYDAIYSLLPPSPVDSSFAMDEDGTATPLGIPLALRLETPARPSESRLVEAGLVQYLVSRIDQDPFVDLLLPADAKQDFQARFKVQVAEVNP